MLMFFKSILLSDIAVYILVGVSGNNNTWRNFLLILFTLVHRFYLSTSPRSSGISRGGQRTHEGTETTPPSTSPR